MALQKSSFAPFLKDLAFKWHVGEVLLDLVLITVCYYAATAALRRRRPRQLSAVFHGVTAGGPGLQARGALRVLASISGRGTHSVFAIWRRWCAASDSGRCLPVAVAFLYRSRAFRARVRAGRFASRSCDHGDARFVPRHEPGRAQRATSEAAGCSSTAPAHLGKRSCARCAPTRKWNMNPMAFIDDDPMKAGAGSWACPCAAIWIALEATMRRYSIDEVILSSPSINGKVEPEFAKSA